MDAKYFYRSWKNNSNNYSSVKGLVDIEILEIPASLVGYVDNGRYGKRYEYGTSQRLAPAWGQLRKLKL